MSPNEANINIVRDQILYLNFTGTVQVSQNKYATMSVAISCNIEPDWAVNWSPITMQFSGSGSQTFQSQVTVYGNKGRSGGNLDIYTNGTTQFYLLTDYQQVHIEAKISDNLSVNQTKPESSSGGILEGIISGSNKNAIIVIAIVTIIVIGGISGYFLIYRRKKAHSGNKGRLYDINCSL